MAEERISQIIGEIEAAIAESKEPPVNTMDATSVMVEAMEEMLGAENVQEAPRASAPRILAIWPKRRRVVFLRLGVHDPRWDQRYMVHRADFRMDENALPIGAAALAAAALKWMQAKP